MEMPVDRLLKQWQSYLTNISSNLMELTDKTEYQLIKLKVDNKTNGYSGITAEKAKKCVESVGKLWSQFALLSEVVEKAAGLNSKRSIMYNSGNEIIELLEKKLIVVDKEHVDISNRNLLEDETDEKMATPKELLKQMQETFQNVCKDISEISTAEEALQSRFDSIKADIARLNAAAARIGITGIPVFDTLRIAELERDPLQGLMELDKLVYSIEKFRASIKSVEDEYKDIVKSLDNVKSIISELRELAAKSKNAIAESNKLFGILKSASPVIGEEIIKSLEDWLNVLEIKLREGSIKAVKVGVSRLEQECSEKLERERENYNLCSRAYNEWLDLKGQFSALVAKSEILESKGLLVDKAVYELKEKTNAALHENTVNLELCRQLVKKLGLSL